MGYVLFTSSGTFKPADYGLAPGDTIQIAAIGGGAGGAGEATFGTAGSASSFGSILTAPGGTACTKATTPGALSEGMLPGNSYVVTTDVLNGDLYGISGQGGPGWMPGEPRRYYELFLLQVTPDDNLRAYWQGAANTPKQQAATTIPLGATSPDWTDYNKGSSQSFFYDGPGGRGYGAGGGASNDGIGGNSGALRFASYVLPNTNGIAVTVGNGGAGGESTSQISGTRKEQVASAGGGARGCVAVFW